MGNEVSALRSNGVARCPFGGISELSCRWHSARYPRRVDRGGGYGGSASQTWLEMKAVRWPNQSGLGGILPRQRGTVYCLSERETDMRIPYLMAALLLSGCAAGGFSGLRANPVSAECMAEAMRTVPQPRPLPTENGGYFDWGAWQQNEVNNRRYNATVNGVANACMQRRGSGG